MSTQFNPGDKVTHINHGDGVILHIYPDTGCEVQFEQDIWYGDNGIVIVSQNCLKLRETED